MPANGMTVLLGILKPSPSFRTTNPALTMATQKRRVWMA